MNLLTETKAFLSWYAAIMARFLRLSFLTTVALVLSAVVARVSKLLARLLPIKVILLASADGVPSYFSRFLTPEQKPIGLVILSLGAVFFLCADTLLTLACQMLAERGSRKVVETANDIVLTSQREQARANYMRVTQVASEALFAAFGLCVIVSAAPHLLAFFVVLVGGAFAFSAWALRPNPNGVHRPVSAFVQNDLNAYLDVVAVVGFVMGFVFILAPFLYGSADVVLALFAITFLRRTINAMESVVADAADLGMQTHKVNALVFRDHQVMRPERTESRLLRELFGRQRRHVQTEGVLSSEGHRFATLHTDWRDTAGGVHRFGIETTDASGQSAQFVERIFPRGQISQLDKEEFLFKAVPRADLLAPAVLTRFTRPPFECQIMDFGGAVRPVERREWRQIAQVVIEHLWSLKPPPALMDAHRATHRQLHDRLSDELFERVSLGLSTPADDMVFQAFTQALPGIREALSQAPMHIANPALTIGGVVLREDGTPVVLDWGRWMIEPIGHGQIPMRADALDAALARVRARRDDIPETFDAKQVLLVASCTALERAVERSMFATALRIAGAIVHAPDASEVTEVMVEEDETEDDGSSLGNGPGERRDEAA